MKRKIQARISVAAAVLIITVFFSACNQVQTPSSSPPYLVDPAKKLAEVSASSFTMQLLVEAANLEPAVTRSGTQVSMGFWSVYSNRACLVRVLDSINSSSTSAAPMNAIWDEGVTSTIQYPSYVRMNEEYWYERANAYGSRLIINGVEYTDPYAVTTADADAIWGAYSTRYAEMANYIKAATGKTVSVYCFVQGAKRNRIFFSYEFSALQTLEANGAVKVYFAQTGEADWQRSSDWLEGTGNAPTPLSRLFIAGTDKSIFSGISGLQNTACVVAELYRDGAYGTGLDAQQRAVKELSGRVPGLAREDYDRAFAKALYLTAF